jgi:hypothetical protein
MLDRGRLRGTGPNDLMPTLKDEFTRALQARIKADAPAQFPAQGWDKIALGKYYPGVDPKSSLGLVTTALGTTIGSVLAAHNWCVSDSDLHSFFVPITTLTTPAAAIERMLVLAGMAFPCP